MRIFIDLTLNGQIIDAHQRAVPGAHRAPITITLPIDALHAAAFKAGQNHAAQKITPPTPLDTTKKPARIQAAPQPRSTPAK